MEMDLKLTSVEYVVFDEADRYVSSLIGGTWCETRPVETLFKLIGQLIEFSYVMLTTVSGSPETLLWKKVILNFFLENLWNTLPPIFNFNQLKTLAVL